MLSLSLSVHVRFERGTWRCPRIRPYLSAALGVLTLERVWPGVLKQAVAAESCGWSRGVTAPVGVASSCTIGSFADCPCILTTSLRFPESIEDAGVGSEVREMDLEEPFGLGVRVFFELLGIMIAV